MCNCYLTNRPRLQRATLQCILLFISSYDSQKLEPIVNVLLFATVFVPKAIVDVFSIYNDFVFIAWLIQLTHMSDLVMSCQHWRFNILFIKVLLLWNLLRWQHCVCLRMHWHLTSRSSCHNLVLGNCNGHRNVLEMFSELVENWMV